MFLFSSKNFYDSALFVFVKEVLELIELLNFEGCIALNLSLYIDAEVRLSKVISLFHIAKLTLILSKVNFETKL